MVAFPMLYGKGSRLCGVNAVQFKLGIKGGLIYGGTPYSCNFICTRFPNCSHYALLGRGHHKAVCHRRLHDVYKAVVT